MRLRREKKATDYVFTKHVYTWVDPANTCRWTSCCVVGALTLISSCCAFGANALALDVLVYTQRAAVSANGQRQEGYRVLGRYMCVDYAAHRHCWRRFYYNIVPAVYAAVSRLGRAKRDEYGAT